MGVEGEFLCRELPVPILTYQLSEEWAAAAQIEQKNFRIQTIQNVLKKLPRKIFRSVKHQKSFKFASTINSFIQFLCDLFFKSTIGYLFLTE